jgi:hypothetical protein
MVVDDGVTLRRIDADGVAQAPPAQRFTRAEIDDIYPPPSESPP